jgi:hypothetical protein
MLPASTASQRHFALPCSSAVAQADTFPINPLELLQLLITGTKDNLHITQGALIIS